jgi:cytochrome c556
MEKPSNWKGFVAAGLVLAALGLAPARADEPAAPAAPVPVGAVPPVPTDPQQAIVVRKETMKTDGKIFRAMKAALEAGQDLRPYAQDAEWFVAWGKEIPAMFPPGSETGHDTKAKPNIWTDKPGFDKFAADMVTAAEALAPAANANDKAAFATNFQALGKACGGCHKAYSYPLH